MSSSSFQFGRRKPLDTAGITGTAAATGPLRAGTARAAAPSGYTPTWASADRHPPAPEVCGCAGDTTIGSTTILRAPDSGTDDQWTITEI